MWEIPSFRDLNLQHQQLIMEKDRMAQQLHHQEQTTQMTVYQATREVEQLTVQVFQAQQTTQQYAETASGLSIQLETQREETRKA